METLKRESDYDSTLDTQLHISRVGQLLVRAAIELVNRGEKHDASKLLPLEKETFDRVTPQLKKLTFGTPEYQASLDSMKEALEHHYQNNSHHPEHYLDGVDGMDLFDLLEMFMDWKAAGERHAGGGDILKSIELNTERFGLSSQRVNILINTAIRYPHLLSKSSM